MLIFVSEKNQPLLLAKGVFISMAIFARSYLNMAQCHSIHPVEVHLTLY